MNMHAETPQAEADGLVKSGTTARRDLSADQSIFIDKYSEECVPSMDQVGRF